MKKFYTKRFSLICAFAASALLLGGGSVSYTHLTLPTIA